MKKTITSALFLGAVLALASYPTFANNSSNNINNNDFSLNEENNSKNRIKQVSLGSKHSSAIATDNNGKDHLYTWGHNSSGELGLETKDTKYTPQEVDINGSGILGDEGTIKQASLGRYHSSAITTDDESKDHLYTWGFNWDGQLGLGITESKNTPQEVDINGNGALGDEETIKQVSLGGYHSSIITTDDLGKNHLYTWGFNDLGQLGIGTEVQQQLTPKEVKFNLN